MRFLFIGCFVLFVCLFVCSDDIVSSFDCFSLFSEQDKSVELSGVVEFNYYKSTR
jgi:hypothetical protein